MSFSSSREGHIPAARHLSAADDRTLRLLAHLPLLPEQTIQSLAGLKGGASVYRHLGRLKEDGVIESIRPSLQPGRPGQLWHLTALGLAVLDPRREVDPRLRNAADVTTLLPGLPLLVALYDLLGVLARARPGFRDLLDWQYPWRRRYPRNTAKAPVAVTVPGYAALEWEEGCGAFLLLPDVGNVRLRAYRSTLDHLFALRGAIGTRLPTLVVVTWDGGRAQGWRELLEETRAARFDEDLPALVTTWADVRAEGLDVSPQRGSRADLAHRARTSVRRRGLDNNVHRSPHRPSGQGDEGHRELGSVALELTYHDRWLLDIIARHPFLPSEALATIVGRDLVWLHERRDHLVRLGLVRRMTAYQSGEGTSASALNLLEATRGGLELVAAQYGMPLQGAVDRVGLVGGGPEHPTGIRKTFVGALEHTLGTDRVFLTFIRNARRMTLAGSDEALVEWRSVAACARGFVRPDGYGIYRRGLDHHGFALEYDRSTMNADDLRKKFRAYYDDAVTGAFLQEYSGFPDILAVTTGGREGENRILEAAELAGVGRGIDLPLFVTQEALVQSADASVGLFGPIWRTRTDSTTRRAWLPRPSAAVRSR